MRIEITTDEFVDLFGAGRRADPQTDHFAKALNTARDSQKLQAIKGLREAYGFGLKQAKDLIEIALGDAHRFS
jgi:ribosomal protein L7/L12